MGLTDANNVFLIYHCSGVEEPGLVMAAQQVISSDKDPTTDPRAG